MGLTLTRELGEAVTLESGDKIVQITILRIDRCSTLVRIAFDGASIIEEIGKAAFPLQIDASQRPGFMSVARCSRNRRVRIKFEFASTVRIIRTELLSSRPSGGLDALQMLNRMVASHAK